MDEQQKELSPEIKGMAELMAVQIATLAEAIASRMVIEAMHLASEKAAQEIRDRYCRYETR